MGLVLWCHVKRQPALVVSSELPRIVLQIDSQRRIEGASHQLQTDRPRLEQSTSMFKGAASIAHRIAAAIA